MQKGKSPLFFDEKPHTPFIVQLFLHFHIQAYNLKNNKNLFDKKTGSIFYLSMTTKRQRAVLKELTLLVPQAPYADSEPIRSAALSAHMRHLPPSIAVWLSIVAYIRHTYTDYDKLRDEGYDKDSARFFVIDDINEKLTEWRATRFVDMDEKL